MVRSCLKCMVYNYEEERVKVKRIIGGRCMKGKNCFMLVVKKLIGIMFKGKVLSEK